MSSGYTENPSGPTVASTTITAPAAGYLVLDGLVNLYAGSSANGDRGSCTLRLNNAPVGSSEYNFTVDDPDSSDETCASRHVAPVTQGTYTVDLFLQGLGGTGTASDGRVTAFYVPFGGSGTRP